MRLRAPSRGAGSISCAKLRWQAFFFTLTICALTLNLAARNTTPQLVHGVAACSSVSQAARQHLDSDRAEWSPPLTHVQALKVAPFHPNVLPGRPALPNLFFEEGLYNRPPPLRPVR